MGRKTLKITQWIIIVLLTLQFLAAGVAKLAGVWNPMFEKWGYPSYFATIIGILEVLSVIGLYPNKLRQYALIVIGVIMLGAIYTHIMATEYVRIIHNIVLILLAIVIYKIGKRLNK